MRRISFALVLVVVAGLLVGALIACSGGGKGGDSRLLHGLANVNVLTTNGKVATCYSSNPGVSDAELLTDTTCGLPQSLSGWTDEPWICPWPRQGSVNMWAFVAYNDLNHNNELDGDAEFLGGSNLFLKRQSTGQFVLVDMVNNPGIIAYDDPTKASIYIDCVHAQRGVAGAALVKFRLDVLAASLR